jgi:DNA-binding HxlR family transcriptional regulator
MNYYQQQNALMSASSIINEKWNLLILHQMFNGRRRFNQIAEALSFLSPTLISKRLKSLENKNVVIKKSKAQGSGFEYYLSALGKKLRPLMNYLYQWGDSCQLENMDAQEQKIHHSLSQNLSMIQLDELPMGTTIIKIHLLDLNTYRNWWLIIENNQISISNSEPSEAADITLSLDSNSLDKLINKEVNIDQLLRQHKIALVGSDYLSKTINSWFVPVTKI